MGKMKRCKIRKSGISSERKKGRKMNRVREEICNACSNIKIMSKGEMKRWAIKKKWNQLWISDWEEEKTCNRLCSAERWCRSE